MGQQGALLRDAPCQQGKCAAKQRYLPLLGKHPALGSPGGRRSRGRFVDGRSSSSSAKSFTCSGIQCELLRLATAQLLRTRQLLEVQAHMCSTVQTRACSGQLLASLACFSMRRLPACTGCAILRNCNGCIGIACFRVDTQT